MPPVGRGRRAPFTSQEEPGDAVPSDRSHAGGRPGRDRMRANQDRLKAEPDFQLMSTPVLSLSTFRYKRAGDDKKLDKMGFTKYVKAGDGFYEKRAGKGPDVIHRDSPIDASDL